MKAILVDDEPNARSLLRNLINDHCKGIEIIEEAPDVKTAVKLLNKHAIDIVFLDIEMPNENGFALFDYFENPTFETIFCTAYSEYAIKAFEVSAADYLLKPISISKLQLAVEKAIKQQGQNQILQKINLLKENITVNQLQKIALPQADGLTFLKIEDILYFEADGSYTHVITNTEKYLISKKIKEFDELLQGDSRFFRVHRSYLVNIQMILKYNKKEGSTLLFENGKVIPVAREKKSEFDEFISRISV
ncbi:LytTR family DNA-binding domain-containing protein [Flavobacterium amniphilum]|uniref:LytR/AlgR family response regulator transcription factor n=1 Tax=Flavobacterium amniphilum TaxID=1834035 RepID=UPI00202A93DC|nr:LytTR family DNA-binding domain-containing protein [Flavobacterium amniphilum]MCL9805787.1 LytTR family DNA-binding domain-containing protein [Flavobacterium amniphilum]MCL9806374.1 LytTR family DNA-binding domain-containing protein [Flavobacterium amniphilum]